MGLFSKKSAPQDPIAFYTSCCKEFHDLAAGVDLARRGLIFIPELIPIGEKTVLAFLQDPFFQMEFQNNPSQYYYAINTLCFMAGIVFADKWHRNYPALQTGFVDEVIRNGPADYANPIIVNVVDICLAEADEFYHSIYEKWLQLHEPYWALKDPREYTFKLMLASYQLGVSMVLEKYGF